MPEDECERAINGFKPLAWDGYSEPFSEISNYVAEAQKAVASGENARRIYSELVSRVMECAPPVMIGQKKSYYHAKYQVVEKATELLFRFGRSRLMNNRKFLVESARFLGHMRVQYEIYRDSRFVMHNVVIMGESEEDRKKRMAEYRVGYQKAALQHTLRLFLEINGKRFGAYAFYGVFDFYESCISAGLSPEFVDRLAVLAKVPSGTFRPDPPPKPDIPKQEEPKVQTNTVSAVVAPVAEESPWGDPHPAYYDDTDEMWEGEDNGGDFQVSYFPDNGHDAWTNAWKEDQIWDWMFSKSLEQGKAAGREGRRDGRLALGPGIVWNVFCRIAGAKLEGYDFGSLPHIENIVKAFAVAIRTSFFDVRECAGVVLLLLFFPFVRVPLLRRNCLAAGVFACMALVVGFFMLGFASPTDFEWIAEMTVPRYVWLSLAVPICMVATATTERLEAVDEDCS